MDFNVRAPVTKSRSVPNPVDENLLLPQRIARPGSPRQTILGTLSQQASVRFMLPLPILFLLFMLTGWAGRHRQNAIDYLAA
jgi:hypothetical protein